MLIRIKSSYFVAGVVLENAKVIQAAPIVNYMRGWSVENVIEYCRAKGWKVQVLRENEKQ